MSDRDLTPEEVEASVKKTLAEAEAAVAAAEESRSAAHKNEAQAESAKLEQKHMKFLIEHSRIESEVAAIALAKCQREERFARVSDIYHHVYTFDQDVNERSVKNCITTLTAWSRDEPQCDIEIIVNSPGGSIIEGFALVDFILNLRSKGHNVSILALGMAASMGGVLLQAGTTRVMGKNAILLIHEGSLGAIGSYGEVEDRVKLMKLFHDRILALFEERAKPINPKTNAAFIRKNWSRTDWWLDSTEALRLGFVDEVR